jgi:hypothetical protein
MPMEGDTESEEGIRVGNKRGRERERKRGREMKSTTSEC